MASIKSSRRNNSIRGSARIPSQQVNGSTVIRGGKPTIDAYPVIATAQKATLAAFPHIKSLEELHNVGNLKNSPARTGLVHALDQVRINGERIPTELICEAAGLQFNSNTMHTIRTRVEKMDGEELAKIQPILDAVLKPKTEQNEPGTGKATGSVNGHVNAEVKLDTDCKEASAVDMAMYAIVERKLEEAAEASGFPVDRLVQAFVRVNEFARTDLTFAKLMALR